MLLLGKKLSVNQWLSVALLTVGIVCVQGLFDAKSPPAAPIASPPAAVAMPPPFPHDIGHASKKHEQHDPTHTKKPHTQLQLVSKAGRSLLQASAGGTADVDKPKGNVPLGVAALLLAAACTSFASVYFEKMLKSDSKPNLWLRNIQLAGYSSLIAILTILLFPDPTVTAHGWFHNFGFNAWLCVYCNALGGLLVAVTIKYADNILRGFAQALAIIMGAIGSHFIFGSTFGASFMLGVALVIASVFLYGAQAKHPSELCCV